MAEELGEKTEHPTGRKLNKARTEGNIAKSADFAAAVDLCGSLLTLVILGPGLIVGMTALLRALLDASTVGAPSRLATVDQVLRFTVTKGVLLAAPFLGILFLVAFASQFVQVGWLWTTKPIMPKFSRLSPMQGFKRVFGKANFVKLVVNSIKLGIVGSIAIVISKGSVQQLAALPALDLVPAFAVVGNIIIELLMWLLIMILIIGIIDFVFQRWHRIQKLKMTKQEVKDEVKQMEGDLQAKARRLGMARAMIYQKMSQNVKTADVVVTNPTHFAVALKYDADKMQAPTVVAKGADYMALRIRQLARDAGVPIVEKPPLARGIYHTVEVGRAIAPEFYQAVAEILAYVYRLKNRAA